MAMKTWSTATPEEILADLRSIVESQPPVPDASSGTWRRWAIEPDGRVVLVEHQGPGPGRIVDTHESEALRRWLQAALTLDDVPPNDLRWCLSEVARRGTEFTPALARELLDERRAMVTKPLQEGADHRPGARKPGHKKAPPMPRWARKRGKQ